MEETKKYILLSLLVIGFLKTLFIHTSLVDAAILAVLGLTFTYYEYRSQQAALKALKDRLDQQEKELVDMKEKVTAISGIYIRQQTTTNKTVSQFR